MADEQFFFMAELQKLILKYGGVASLLFGGLWYQTDRINTDAVKNEKNVERLEGKNEKNVERLENRIKEVEQGLNNCSTERAALKIQVDYIQKTVIANYGKLRK